METLFMGLTAAYIHTVNTKALEVVEKLCEWADETTKSLLLFKGVQDVDARFTNDRIGDPLPYQEGRWMKEVSMSQRELAVDAVISNPAGTEFRYPSAKGGYRYSNHMDSETDAAGGNVLFLDGSVRWRPISERTKERAMGAPPFWW